MEEEKNTPVTTINLLSSLTPNVSEVETTKKYTEYKYLLERKSIRLMRKFYKDRFDKFSIKFKFKQRVRFMSLQEMDQVTHLFVQHEFPSFLSNMSIEQLVVLYTALKSIILCDRHKKNEPVIEGLDFKVIRSIL